MTFKNDALGRSSVSATAHPSRNIGVGNSLDALQIGPYGMARIGFECFSLHLELHPHSSHVRQDMLKADDLIGRAQPLPVLSSLGGNETWISLFDKAVKLERVDGKAFPLVVVGSLPSS